MALFWGMPNGTVHNGVLTWQQQPALLPSSTTTAPITVPDDPPHPDLTEEEISKMDISRLSLEQKPAAPDLSKGPPRLLEYPPEIREMIYARAVSVEGKILVKSKRCQPPALAQANRQLRSEVVPVFYGCNTFHFHSITRIHAFHPLASPRTIHWLALDLETSIKFHHTLVQHLLQPTKLLFEERFLTFKESHPGTLALRGGTVLWGTRERIIESLAENPRPYPFLTKAKLEASLREREEVEKERMRVEKERSKWEKVVLIGE